MVDDEELIREAVKAQLEARGVAVTDFSGGKEMLEALAKLEKHPTAVLLDYVMQPMSGEELLQHLQKNYARLPVIVYSGLDLQGSAQAYGKGAYATMHKPLDYSELMDTLKELANLVEVFMSLAEDMLQITGFDYCFVWQLDRKQNDYRIVGQAGEIRREFMHDTRMSEEEFPRIKKLKAGGVAFWEDVRDPSLSPEYVRREEAADRGWVSLIAIPIMRNKRLIGWIDCYKSEVHHFKNEKQKTHQLGYLQKYAVQVGESLHAALLTQQLRVQQEINQSLAITPDEAWIHETILVKTIELTGADFGWIYSLNMREKKLELAYVKGIAKDKVDQVRELNEGITGKAAFTGQSIIVEDVNRSSPEDPSSIFIPTPGVEVASEVATPLRRGTNTLGVLTLKSKQPSFFTTEDVHLLLNLAASAALAMERAKLTHYLREISLKAQENIEFDKLAQYIVDAVQDLMGAAVNIWMMSDKEGEGDEWMRIKTSSKGEPEFLQEYIENACVPSAPDKCIIANALHNKKYIIINDFDTYDHKPPFYHKEQIELHKWKSYMAVPLLGKNGEHLGALSLYSPSRNKFSEENGRLIQHFADQAALALQEQRHFTILQELAKIGTGLAVGLPGTGDLLKKATQLARQISKAELTVLYPYDPMRKTFYDRSAIVHDGEMRSLITDLKDRPRVNGMAAYIRQHVALVVENIGPDGIEMGIGLTNPKRYYQADEPYEKVLGFIRDSKFIKRENIRSFIGVSLQAIEQKENITSDDNTEVAVLYFNFRRPRHFSQEELQLIDIFCHQVANIIHRNRLFDRINRQKNVLEGVHNAAVHILSKRDQQERLEGIVREAVKLLDAKGGKIYLTVNGSRRDLKLVAAQGLPPEIMEVGEILEQGTGMAGNIVKTQEAAIENNYPENPYRIERLAHFFSAVVEVPLVIQGELIGVLGVFDEHREFHEEDKRVLMRLGDQAALAIYNIKLFDELDALYQTGILIASRKSLKVTAPNILRALKKVIEYDKATIQLIKDKTKPREILEFEGFGPEKINSRLLKPVIHDPIIGPIVERKETYILSDTYTDLRWSRNIEETKDVRSWACVPLVYGKQVLGLLILDHHQPDYYSESDREKLERFANQAAIAIYNASIEEQHLATLSEFTNRITRIKQEDTKEGVFIEAVEIFRRTLNPTSCTFYYIEESYLNIQNLRQSLGECILAIKPLVEGEGMAGEVAQVGEAVLVPDDLKGMPLEKGVRPVSALLAPIWKEGIVAGVIELISNEHKFNSDQKRFFAILLAEVGIAVQHIEQRERKIEAIQRRYNPYKVGPPITNPVDFFGRKKVVGEILAGLHNNHYIILDERRIGKTSVLYQIKFHLENNPDEDYVFYPVFIDLSTVEVGEFWRKALQRIYGSAGRKRPKLTDNFSSGQFADNLYELLNELEAEADGRSVRIVLLIDEVDVIDSYGANFQNVFRGLLSEENRLKVIMSGLNIQQGVENITSPWYNYLIPTKLSHMKESEARSLILESVRKLYRYTPEAVDQILIESALKPHRIQQLCYLAVIAMLDRIHKKSEGAPNPNEAIIIEGDVRAAKNILSNNPDFQSLSD